MAAERKPIVVVGSINIDLVVKTVRIPVEGETIHGNGFEIHSGGKGANQAVAVASLGYPVHMIGRVGSDAFGRRLRDDLGKAGVDTSAVMVSEGTSGVAMIAVAESGQNSIVIVPGANALLTPEDLDANIAQLKGAGMVLAQLEVPLATVEHLASICSSEGIPLMLDPAPARALSADFLRSVEWLTPNETEAAFYIASDIDAEHHDPSETVDRLRSQGARGVVLKLGSAGAYLVTNAGAHATIQCFPVNAIDTTAAGDCFNGGFAVGLLMGMQPAEAAHFGSAAAAISATRSGAQPSMPSLSEVEQLLRSG